MDGIVWSDRIKENTALWYLGAQYKVNELIQRIKSILP